MDKLINLLLGKIILWIDKTFNIGEDIMKKYSKQILMIFTIGALAKMFKFNVKLGGKK